MRTIGAAGNIAQSSPSADAPGNLFAELCKPLPFLLAGGGDDRLTFDFANQTNMYGCAACPAPRTIAFSSSTATSISERAYARAGQAREELFRENIACGFERAFDLQIERMRQLMMSCLKLNGTGADIIFSPSGTDSQLHALLISRQLLNGPTTCIVIGAEQTGRGTAHTSRGRHFSDLTAQGKSVRKSLPVVGGTDTISLGISLFDQNGQPRRESDIDAAVIKAIDEQLQAGRKVILQTMESSKLGWRGPSDACLRHVAAIWPQDVQIVVDACQFRIGRPRLRSHLEQGHIVLVTGSKFFTGPAFSGASLWPEKLSKRIARMTSAVGGLQEYATRFDLPQSWNFARETLAATPNLGQWLRWEAALEEMRAYYELPDSFRQSALACLANSIPAAIAASRHLKLLASQDVRQPDAADEELQNRTIFSFRVESNGHVFGFDDLTKIYHALNRDISAAASKGDHGPASQLCHIGQPVEIAGGAVLRIAVGARHLTEAWSADAAVAEENSKAVVGQVAQIMKKLDLIIAAKMLCEAP